MLGDWKYLKFSKGFYSVDKVGNHWSPPLKPQQAENALGPVCGEEGQEQREEATTLFECLLYAKSHNRSLYMLFHLTWKAIL